MAHPVGAEDPRIRVDQLGCSHSAAPADNQSHRPMVAVGGTNQVVNERQRRVVSPLHVIDDNEHRRQRADRQVRSLEQANLVHGIARRPRLRHKLTEGAPLGRSAQLLDELPRARQRHALLQLVAGDRDRRRHTIEISQFGEQARLPDSGIANDNSDRGKVIVEHELAQVAQRGDLGGPANKLHGHQRQRYDGSTAGNCRLPDARQRPGHQQTCPPDGLHPNPLADVANAA